MIRPPVVVQFVFLIGLTGVLSGCGGSSSNGGGGGTGSGNWSIKMSASGNFRPGGSGDYTIVVTNASTGASSGTVTVTDTLPTGLSALHISAFGSGWSCTLSGLACTNATTLSPGAAFPAIVVSVSVSQSAQGTVTNTATVSGGGLSSATANDATQIGSGGGSGKINHVVVIFQENRSTDNLFQGLCTNNPSACGTGANQYNIQSYGYNSSNQKISLTPVSLQTDYDLDHGHPAFLSACQWNGTACAMNGSDLVKCSPPANCPPNPQFQYVQASDVKPYLTMATTYAFGDNMFQTNQGPSFPAHQYILSGTSTTVPQGGCGTGTGASCYVAGNPANNERGDGTSGAGCLTPPGSGVNVIDTSQPFPNGLLYSLAGSECFEHPTLTDLLDQSGLTWKYYAPQDGSIWTAPDAIQHMCQPSGPQDQLFCSGPDWTSSSPNVVIEGTGAQVLTDIGNGQLADVTWIIPDGSNSDHAASNKGTGPSWVSAIVNAIGESPFWSDTAIILTWDDWGGWYDHVPPPIHGTNSYEYGFRVPILVISPYSKPAYVSHQQSDFGSILLFIEEQFFPVGTYINGGGYADSYALSDLSDFFNFSQTPLVFTPIQAPQDAQHFLNSKEKPTPPDND